ncbi:MAG: hypothetical protein M0P58_08410 [Bacteroidales bacterium]|nr:hypothetical protein [Bacteroidales bacterium]
MIRCRLFLLILFFGMMVSSSGQGRQKDQGDPPLRIEIPAKSDKETYRIIPCDTAGMILFFRSIEVADGNQVKWYFSFYDKNLKLIWTRSIPLLSDQDYFDHQIIDDTLSMLFVHTGNTPRSGVTAFEILRVSLVQGIFILNTGNVPVDGDVAAFGIRDDNAWLGINIKGKAGQIGHLRLSSGIFNTFQSGIGNSITIPWIRPDSLGNTVFAIVSRKVAKKTTEYYLVSYDSAGKIRNEISLHVNTVGQALSHFQYREINPGTGIVVGSYGQETATTKQKIKETEELTGLFTASVANRSLKSISFYNFLELKNVSSLLTEKDMSNLIKKSSKKNKELKDFSVSFSLLLHDIIPWKDQYIVIAEIYAPQYHTENFTEIDYYGRPYTNSYSVFDGYQFINAIVTGFSHEGKLLWDNVLEIRNLVSFDLTAKVSSFFSGDDLVLCYLSDGRIGSKIIQGDKVIEKSDFSPLELMFDEDKLLSESRSRIVPWYGNNFLAYGYQEIKNIALTGNNKRLVFFFSKVKFEK